MKSFFKSLLPGISIFLAVVGCIVLIFGAQMAVTPWWRIPLIAIVVALLITRGGSAAYLPNVMGLRNVFIKRFISLVVALGIIGGILTALNFIPHPGVAPEKQKCVITRLYRTTHQHTKRVGRRYVSTGSVYYRYHADVSLPSGIIKEYPLSYTRFRHLHKGDSLTCTIHPGLLGTDFFSPD
ncbi:MAG: hypothetical protein K2M06_04875 [Muribaculaceae bacterium]|nr:hypothetical protein [Muribaculaceae bacterium]